MFKRKAYDELLRLKNLYKGTRAFMLEGARRVGKSTIAEEFAKNEYKSYILIDFANVGKRIKGLFEYISDLDYFFLQLQTILDVKLYKRESVIIFDEVQLFPAARQAIKYLVKDGRYDYIETGSLISIKKNIQGILIPSEEVKIQVNPMDYEEFCHATGKEYSLLEELYHSKYPAGEAVNRKLVRDFRLYIAVGGMPQVVDAYIKNNNFDDVEAQKRSIIALYKEDLKRIDGSGRLGHIFESIPSQLALKRKAFSIYSATKSNETEKDSERISDLIDSKIVNPCYLVRDPSVSLKLTADYSSYKLYMADTGLFISMLLESKKSNYKDIYQKLLSDKLELNLGYLYENIVSQMLIANGEELYYYTWKKKDSTHDYEIDFLTTDGNKVVPFEVKSGKTSSHQSIDAFAVKYSSICGHRYLLSNKDKAKDRDLINVPYYLFDFVLKSLD